MRFTLLYTMMRVLDLVLLRTRGFCTRKAHHQHQLIRDDLLRFFLDIIDSIDQDARSALLVTSVLAEFSVVLSLKITSLITDRDLKLMTQSSQRFINNTHEFCVSQVDKWHRCLTAFAKDATPFMYNQFLALCRQLSLFFSRDNARYIINFFHRLKSKGICEYFFGLLRPKLLSFFSSPSLLQSHSQSLLRLPSKDCEVDNKDPHPSPLEECKMKN